MDRVQLVHISGGGGWVGWVLYLLVVFGSDEDGVWFVVTATDTYTREDGGQAAGAGDK